MTESVKPLLSRITSFKCGNNSRPASDLQTHAIHFYTHQHLTQPVYKNNDP